MTATAPYFRVARVAREQVRLDPARVPADLSQAYRAMARLTSVDPCRWAAWKLGGTNAGSRAAFGVDQLYYGAIAREEILHSPCIAPAAPLAELQGEVEIALRVAPDQQGFDAWAVALEMPASGIANLIELGVTALVADRCAAGCLVLGPINRGPLLPEGACLAQAIDGRLAGEGASSCLVASPASLLSEFLDLARSHAAPVSAGDWVATGGITPCLKYRSGQRVTVTLDGAVVIDVTIGTAVQ